LVLSDVQPCSDEEYLGGCIAMGHELLEYCVGRAAVADLTTIKYCHLLVTQLSDALNQFEFRNSPLRRKYDSLKYVVKKLTDIIYELGLALDLSACRTAGASGAAPTSVVGEESTPRKKARATEDDAWQPNAEVELELVSKTLFEEIRSRLDAYDRKREELIKATRDVQKLAKQGIYAVHRDMGKPFPKFDDATSKFKEGNKLLVGLFDVIVASHPPLRQGSFSAAIEELLEGILVLHWCQQRQLLSKADCEARINACRACGLGCESATPIETIPPLTVTDVEYFGAMSDLTGELGRIAVFQAMKRDVSCVEAILGTDTAVAQLLVRVSCEGSGGGGRGGMGKKVDAVLVNRKKVMELRYDMACLALSGGVRASTIGVGDASELGAGTGSDDA
jgi:predicted translin family RNA/ssDNA-binding protein